MLYRDEQSGWVRAFRQLSTFLEYSQLTFALHRETNLKIKQGIPATAVLTSPMEVARLAGTLRSEQPNNSLYTFEATLTMKSGDGSTKELPLGPDQVLLRGAQLRNTAWMYGLVVFTGHETKLMRNAT